jgi:tetratricopeptide (TPR) repeat protein
MKRIAGFILAIAAFAMCVSCGRNRIMRQLSVIETVLESNPDSARTLLADIDATSLYGKPQALYALLKTHADCKCYIDIPSDSLIRLATDYYGTRRKSFHAAMSWYSQGCVYSKMGSDMAAIYAYIKAKDMFPDTLVRYYAITEKNLGGHYFNKRMFKEAFEQFNCCKINAERLQDKNMLYYASCYLTLCAIHDEDIPNIGSLSSLLFGSQDDPELPFVESQKRIPMYYPSSSEPERDTVFKTVTFYSFSDKNSKNNKKDKESQHTYYALKADLFFQDGNYDSAYVYYKYTFNDTMMDIYGRIIQAEKLVEVSAKIGDADETYRWHKYYISLLDSINNVEKTDSKEVLDMQYLHREELAEEKMHSRNQRFIIIIISSVILIITMTILVYVLLRNRDNKRIIQKQNELIELERKIRRSSIAILETQVREQSQTDSDARTALLELYNLRLNVGKDLFYKSSAYKILTSVVHGGNLNMDDRNTIIETLKQSFIDSIADMQIEYPGIDTEESLTLILSAMHIKNEIVSELFGNVTADAIRKRKYRFGKSNPDYYALFC